MYNKKNDNLHIALHHILLLLNIKVDTCLFMSSGFGSSGFKISVYGQKLINLNKTLCNITTDKAPVMTHPEFISSNPDTVKNATVCAAVMGQLVHFHTCSLGFLTPSLPPHQSDEELIQ